MHKTTIGLTFLYLGAVGKGEPAGRLAMKPYFGGRAGRLYSDRKQQPVMFSSSSCNFFMPFAQKDARFASAANGRAAMLPGAQEISREIKA
jgi:hypothetical protein